MSDTDNTLTPEQKEVLNKAVQSIAKRYATAHKASLAKVSSHLAMAKSNQTKGMDCLGKAAKCMVEAKKLNKAADGDELAGHVAKAHGYFGKAADNMMDMEAHLGKAMGAWGHDTNVSEDTETGGEITLPTLAELTEGDVPQYVADEPYGKLLKTLQESITKGELISKEAAEKMAKDAAEKAEKDAKTAALLEKVESLSKQVDQLSRLPSGSPKVRVFDFDKSALPALDGGTGNVDENKLRMAALLEGVNLDMENDNDFQKAAGGMIANMLKNGPKFGKTLFGKAPMYDASFHGRGGTGARN
jgi:hypothetical protein